MRCNVCFWSGVLAFVGCVPEPDASPTDAAPPTMVAVSTSPTTSSGSSWEVLMTSTSMPQPDPEPVPTSTAPLPIDPVCGNSKLEPGEECDPPDPLQRCNDQCTKDLLLFVTSGVFTPFDLGGIYLMSGVDVADYYCTQYAIIAGFVLEDEKENALPFRAWLSTPLSSPQDRFMWSMGKVIRPDGEIIAEDLMDMDQLQSTPSLTEKMELYEGYVWSNTTTNGATMEPGKDCALWTSSSEYEQGHVGFSGSTSESWTHLQSPANPSSCETAHPIYCVEQIGSRPVR